MDETIDFQDLPPTTPGHRLDEVSIWIGVHVDGSETILSADLPMQYSDGTPAMRHMPLMHSMRERAEPFAGLARKIQREAMHRSDRLIRIELRTFRKVGAT
jgi:hypothetical protein